MGTHQILQVGDRVRLGTEGADPHALGIVTKIFAPEVGEESDDFDDCLVQIMGSDTVYYCASENLTVLASSPVTATRDLFAVGDRVAYDYQRSNGTWLEIQGILLRFTEPVASAYTGEVADCTVRFDAAPDWPGREIHASTATLRYLALPLA